MRDEIQAMSTKDAAALGKLAGDRSIDALRAGRPALAEAYKAVLTLVQAVVSVRRDPTGTPLGLDLAIAEQAEWAVRDLSPEDRQAFRDAWTADAAEDGPLAAAAFAIAHCADGPPESDPDDVGAPISFDEDGRLVSDALASHEADEIQRARLEFELEAERLADADDDTPSS